ncbi:MAG TPA: hypothetical protein VNI57_14940, partial [Candidatus Saccharimonadales bacterium]|nr:hypothetical protein [Candidatus Saccharimonadales bacterium]
DAAVCPAGMMSAGLPPGVEVGAIFADGERAYRWVSCGRTGPGSLAHGATVVTWDDVSRAQILFRYPGLQVESARGWTKVFSGLRQGIWGAACLPPEVVDAGSLWGLDTGLIAIDEVMPAIGQGSAAILTPRAGVDPVVRGLNCPDRARRLRLESAFWWNVTDIPGTVVTASARFEEGRVIVEGLVAEADGAWLVSDRGEAGEAYAAAVVRDVADSCREMTWGRRARKEIAAHALHGRRAS